MSNDPNSRKNETLEPPIENPHTPVHCDRCIAGGPGSLLFQDEDEHRKYYCQ